MPISTRLGTQRHGLFMTILGTAALLSPMMLNAVQAAPPPGEYKVGFIAEKTGPIAAAGITFARGAELAVEEMNATSYIGSNVKVSLVEKESGTDTARGIQALSQFIADRSILAVSCCLLSPTVNAMKPVTKNGKMPMVIYGATAPGLPEPPYVYNASDVAGLRDVFMAKRLSEEIKPKSVAYFVMADNETYQGRMKASQKIMEEAGAATAGVISVFGADTDFTAPATQAMALNPDMIQIYAIQTPTAGIIAALRARGYKGVIATSDVIASMAVFKKLGPSILQIPFPTNFSPDLLSDPAAKNFAMKYSEKYGEKPDSYAVQGYTALYFIGQGMKGLNAAPTRETLGESMSKMTSLERNLYGGLPIQNGQAILEKPILAQWSEDGKIIEWKKP